MPDPQRQQEPRPYNTDSPASQLNFTLYTKCAQAIWDRESADFDRILDRIENYLSKNCTKDEYEKLEEALYAELDKLDRSLEQNLATCQMPTAGPKVVYPKKRDIACGVHSAAMVRVVNSILKVDELAIRMEANMFNLGMRPSKLRNDYYDWLNYYRGLRRGFVFLFNGGWKIVNDRQRKREEDRLKEETGKERSRTLQSEAVNEEADKATFNDEESMELEQEPSQTIETDSLDTDSLEALPSDSIHEDDSEPEKAIAQA
ncbi:MAG: hypothetical protein LUC43_09450 [Burkholderiales bacterium]|nr:hypothetical protein [Burkholderiales bacterium]